MMIWLRWTSLLTALLAPVQAAMADWTPRETDALASALACEEGVEPERLVEYLVAHQAQPVVQGGDLVEYLLPTPVSVYAVPVSRIQIATWRDTRGAFPVYSAILPRDEPFAPIAARAGLVMDGEGRFQREVWRREQRLGLQAGEHVLSCLNEYHTTLRWLKGLFQ